MKRVMVLATLLIAGALSLAVTASQQPAPGAAAEAAAPKVVIDPSENHKQLVVKYSECGRTVTNRVMSIKDLNDKTLKEWRFEGSTSGLLRTISDSAHNMYPADGLTDQAADFVAQKVASTPSAATETAR